MSIRDSLDAILFGGRRKTTVPLVTESFDWEDGVLKGATLSSETTAAAAGAVGVVRRDPMAMLPFLGYDAGDYLAHWAKVSGECDPEKLPRIYLVNWFRRNRDGGFAWPGFGENSRVLKWVVERLEGKADATETPIGHVPTPESLDLTGIEVKDADLEDALKVDPAEWETENELIAEWLEKFGGTLPESVRAKFDAQRERFEAQKARAQA